jgi:5'(3')-deoxyribonucleotidase
MYDNLNDANFTMFAMKHYENPHCTDILEFQDDLKRIRYIRRLFSKYEQTGDLKDRLILNHLIILYNVFEPKATTKMLILKLSDQLHYLKPFLVFLNYWTTDVGLVNGKRIIDSDIMLDQNIVKILREVHG